MPDEIIYVKVAHEGGMEIKVEYELSGVVTGINPDIKVSKGDVLIFELDAEGHPFWIKTVMGIGQGNAVTSGISGVRQGKTSGILIWNTTEISENTYYYQCEFHANMVGKIIVGEGILNTKFLIASHSLVYPLR